MASEKDKTMNRHAENRSDIYRMFTQAFSSPKTEIFQNFFELETTVLEEAGFAGIVRAFNSVDLDALMTIYSSQFEVGNAPVSLHGRDHLPQCTPKKLFEDLFRVYEFFGLDFKDNKLELWPDNLLVELEFMQYLIYLQNNSQGDKNGFILAQKDFIERHLQPFSQGLSQLINEKDISPYTVISSELKSFISSDLEYLHQLIKQGSQTPKTPEEVGV